MSKESLQEFPIKHEHISWNHIESTSVVNQKNGILLGRFMLCYKPCFLNLRTRSPLNHIKTCVLSFVFLLLATTMLLRAIFILNYGSQSSRLEGGDWRREEKSARKPNLSGSWVVAKVLHLDFIPRFESKQPGILNLFSGQNVTYTWLIFVFPLCTL